MHLRAIGLRTRRELSSKDWPMENTSIFCLFGKKTKLKGIYPFRVSLQTISLAGHSRPSEYSRTVSVYSPRFWTFWVISRKLVRLISIFFISANNIRLASDSHPPGSFRSDRFLCNSKVLWRKGTELR